jgi:hypothetical protein
MTTREEVYKAIDSERDYQDSKWVGTRSGDKPGGGALDRTLDEFSLYIQGYTNDLVDIASHIGPSGEKLNCVRKIAALAVACMEAHGAPLRSCYRVPIKQRIHKAIYDITNSGLGVESVRMSFQSFKEIRLDPVLMKDIDPITKRETLQLGNYGKIWGVTILVDRDIKDDSVIGVPVTLRATEV